MLDDRNSDTDLRKELRQTRFAIGSDRPPSGLMGRLVGEKRQRRRMGRRIVALAIVLASLQYGYARHGDSETCVRGDHFRVGQLELSDVQTQVYGDTLHGSQAQIDKAKAQIRVKATDVNKLRACPGILPWTYNLPSDLK